MYLANYYFFVPIKCTAVKNFNQCLFFHDSKTEQKQTHTHTWLNIIVSSSDMFLVSSSFHKFIFALQ